MMNDFTGHASKEEGLKLLRAGRLHECIACMEQFIDAYPDDASAYLILGAAYSQAGDHAMAIAAFEHSIAEENTARAHFNLGRAYEQAGRIKNAADEYKIAAEMDPEYTQAKEALKRVNELIAEEVKAMQNANQPHVLGSDDDQDQYEV